jgi:hypothetical protein
MSFKIKLKPRPGFVSSLAPDFLQVMQECFLIDELAFFPPKDPRRIKKQETGNPWLRDRELGMTVAMMHPLAGKEYAPNQPENVAWFMAMARKPAAAGDALFWEAVAHFTKEAGRIFAAPPSALPWAAISIRCKLRLVKSLERLPSKAEVKAAVIKEAKRLRKPGCPSEDSADDSRWTPIFAAAGLKYLPREKPIRSKSRNEPAFKARRK